MSQGYSVLFMNPARSQSLRMTYKPHFKTDKINSFIVAKGLKLGIFVGELYEQNYQVLKELVQYRQSLKKQLTAVKNQITSILDRQFPEYQTIFSNIFSKVSITLFRQVCDPLKTKNLAKRTYLNFCKRKGR